MAIAIPATAGESPRADETALVVHVDALDVIDPEMEQDELPGTPEPERYEYPISGFRADYKDAPDLLEIAQEVTQEYPRFGSLANTRIRFYWWRKIGTRSCEAYYGKVKKVSGIFAHHVDDDAYIALSTVAAGAGSWTREQVKNALYHMLAHLQWTAKGQLAIGGHDWSGFSSEVRELGPWSPPLKLGRNAYRQARLDGLLDDESDDEWGDVGVQ